MPPKQATLGYVKDSQTTLGFVCLYFTIIPGWKAYWHSSFLYSKFFGNPNAPKAPAKQSKLAFSTKSTNPTSKSEIEDEEKSTDVKVNASSEVEEKNSIAKEEEDALESNESVKVRKGTELSLLARIHGFF
jgi:DNA ligase-1